MWLNVSWCEVLKEVLQPLISFRGLNVCQLLSSLQRPATVGNPITVAPHLIDRFDYVRVDLRLDPFDDSKETPLGDLLENLLAGFF